MADHGAKRRELIDLIDRYIHTCRQDYHGWRPLDLRWAHVGEEGPSRRHRPPFQLLGEEEDKEDIGGSIGRVEP
jgi:hypothetical protein